MGRDVTGSGISECLGRAWEEMLQAGVSGRIWEEMLQAGVSESL